MPEAGWNLGFNAPEGMNSSILPPLVPTLYLPMSSDFTRRCSGVSFKRAAMAAFLSFSFSSLARSNVPAISRLPRAAVILSSNDILLSNPKYFGTSPRSPLSGPVPTNAFKKPPTPPPASFNSLASTPKNLAAICPMVRGTLAAAVLSYALPASPFNAPICPSRAFLFSGSVSLPSWSSRSKMAVINFSRIFSDCASWSFTVSGILDNSSIMSLNNLSIPSDKASMLTATEETAVAIA